MRSLRIVAALSLTLALTACAGGDSSPPSVSPTAPQATASATPSEPRELNVFEQAQLTEDFYVGNSGQSGTAYLMAVTDGEDEKAAQLAKIAFTPQAEWFGAWTPAANVEGNVRSFVDKAEASGKPGVMAIYAIPSLDCSFFGAGGLEAETYITWIEAVARGIDGRDVWLVLEPDALAQMGDCEGQGDRAGLLGHAAQILDDAGARVYLDSGNSAWHTPEEMARRIDLVGTEHLAGFATNVSNYHSSEQERAQNDQIAALTSLHYVIDTSRNGNGSGVNNEWCNASGRALGEHSRLVNEGALDAYLWVKRPGESDGPCNGGPSAGAWWLAGALELARNA